MDTGSNRFRSLFIAGPWLSAHGAIAARTRPGSGSPAPSGSASGCTRRLRLGAEAGPMAGAVAVAATADLQVQTDQPLQSHDCRRAVAAHQSGPAHAGQVRVWVGRSTVRSGWGRALRRGIGLAPRSGVRSRSNDFTALDQRHSAGPGHEVSTPAHAASSGLSCRVTWARVRHPLACHPGVRQE